MEGDYCYEAAALSYNLALGLFNRPSDVVDQLKSQQEAAMKRHREDLEDGSLECIDEPA